MLSVIYAILGVTSDLSRKKLIPATFQLWKDKRRKDLSRADFEQLLKDGLLSVNSDEQQRNHFIAASHYFQLNYDEKASYDNLRLTLTRVTSPDSLWIFHLALPPDLFMPTLQALRRANLHTLGQRESHFLIEKPFGHNFNSASELIKQTNKLFSEKQIYRVDHYLGKESVRNILPFRLQNPDLEKIWNHKYIDRIQIIAAESEGVQSRGNYYDKSGAIRDMVQSHCLELLAITAMEPPQNDEESPRQSRVDLLRAIETKQVTTGQYEGYLREDHVNPTSKTETFAAVIIVLNNARWLNTPVSIVTGKMLKEKKTRVVIAFKPSVRGQIEKQLSQFKNKKAKFNQASGVLEFGIDSSTPKTATDDAYVNLITDCITGKHSFFVRNDEVLAAWRAVEPALNYAKNHRPKTYRPGSSDPISL
jgi:glucose-6-phosphate 1-dehydrogenase